MSVRAAHLRVARATDNLPEIVRFYRDALGFELLGSFQDHESFDGVMLGHAGAGYHLEFTHRRGESVGRAPTTENLLVFYLPDRGEWEQAVHRMRSKGYEPVKSHNPYWEQNGLTFQDPDGYRIVLRTGPGASERRGLYPGHTAFALASHETPGAPGKRPGTRCSVFCFSSHCLSSGRAIPQPGRTCRGLSSRNRLESSAGK